MRRFHISNCKAVRTEQLEAQEGKLAICDLQSAICNLLVLIAAAWAIPASAASDPAPADPFLRKAPTWQPVKPGEVKSQVMKWLDGAKADGAAKAKAAELWAGVAETAPGPELLEKLAQTVALADNNAAKLVELCVKPRSQLVLPSQPWLTDPKQPPLVAANLRLYYARWLIQNSLYDEAHDLLAGLKPADVVAPAELLFYQGVVYHRMLNKEEGMKVLDQLLDGAEASPRRYVAVGRLMYADLSVLEPDTLDHIARRMSDIERRLDLGRAGPKVRKVEDGVIESLDKLIKKLEEEQQKQQQQQASQGGRQPNNPMQQSAPAAGGGPGEVVRRKIGSKADWGNMSPKEREKVLQEIGSEYPPHYRDIIEQYFRRQAAEENSENK